MMGGYGMPFLGPYQLCIYYLLSIQLVYYTVGYCQQPPYHSLPVIRYSSLLFMNSKRRFEIALSNFKNAQLVLNECTTIFIKHSASLTRVKTPSLFSLMQPRRVEQDNQEFSVT